MKKSKVKQKIDALQAKKSIGQLTRLHANTVNKMNTITLRAVVQKMASAANKRVKRIKSKGISTPATREAERVGKFSTKGKNINELRAEYKRIKAFLKSPSSTIKGYKKQSKRFAEKLNKIQDQNRKRREKKLAREGILLPPSEPQKSIDEYTVEDFYNKYDKLWRVIDRLREKYPWMDESQKSAPMVSSIDEYIENHSDKSVDDLVDDLSLKAKQAYKESNERDETIDWSAVIR